MNKKIKLPLINTHAHAAMTGFRGLAEDMSLDEWLTKHIWPAEARSVNPKFVYEQTKVAIAEMRANGIEAFMDMYFFGEEVARAAQEMKINAVVSEALIDFPTPSCATPDDSLRKIEEMIIKYRDDEFVSVSVAPHSIYTVCEENLLKSKELARKYNVIWQTHLAESKKEFDDCQAKHNLTPTAYLDKLNLLDEKSVLAHCVWLTDEDIEIIARSGATVSHCPLSNLKLGSGIAPVAKMLSKGVKVTLGTDGSASSNRLDIWEAGKFAALLQKGVNNDPSLLPVKQVLEMMTINGMDALGLRLVNGISVQDIREYIANNDFSNLYFSQSI